MTPEIRRLVRAYEGALTAQVHANHPPGSWQDESLNSAAVSMGLAVANAVMDWLDRQGEGE